MKKIVSLALALVLSCSLALPASAADSADERLAAVTAQVKDVLDLDTDAYSSFYGDLDDNPLSPSWYLEWSGEDGWLFITASEDGKVLSYDCSAYQTSSSSSNQFAPAFPAGDRESAKAAAQTFLNKVLAKGETAVFSGSSGSASLNATRYRFSGEILLNGLSANLSFSISVNCEDNKIVSFYRDDLGGIVMGGIPAPNAAVSKAQAAQALRDTLALRLEYVLAEGDDTHAVLRYLPEYGDRYYVDAAAGALVNLSELERKASIGDFGGASNGASAAGEVEASADASAPSPSLSPAELEGVTKLEGVLDRDALDAKAREIEALGLNSYALAAVSYSVDRDEPEEGGETPVTAVLRYGRQVNDVSWRRTVSLDARTGELLAVSSSGRLAENDSARTVNLAAAQKAAESFLTQRAPDQFAKTELYNSSEASSWSISHSFVYAQKENGYFFTGNAFYVGVDVTDGSISSYEKYFNDAVTFDSPEGILTMDQAVDAWLGTYETTLEYVWVPAAIDFSQPEYEPLQNYGVSFLYQLVLGYQLERFEFAYGIDAKTGEPVYHSWQSGGDGLIYDDLTGHWAKAQIETLAQYGVGYAGGSFQPGKALTQLDMVALLMSTKGYLYQPDEEGAADALYDYACSRGLLTRQERDDNAVLTRTQAVRLLLDAAGYGAVAQLEGIFRTGFADDGDIPAEYYGYAALAQGLGIVSGTPGSLFLPNDTATRAEAAVMLYNLMSQ